MFEIEECLLIPINLGWLRYMFNPNLSTTHRCHLTDTVSLTCWTNNTFVCVLLICQGSSLIHQKVAPPAEGHGSPVLSFIALEQFNAVRLVQVSALLRTIALAAVITQPCSNAVGGKTKKNTRHRRVWWKTSASTPSFTWCFMSWRVPLLSDEIPLILNSRVRNILTCYCRTSTNPWLLWVKSSEGHSCSLLKSRNWPVLCSIRR